MHIPCSLFIRLVLLTACSASAQDDMRIKTILPFHWTADGEDNPVINAKTGATIRCGSQYEGGLRVYVDVDQCGGPVLEVGHVILGTQAFNDQLDSLEC